jgi:hypothetical protein
MRWRTEYDPNADFISFSCTGCNEHGNHDAILRVPWEGGEKDRFFQGEAEEILYACRNCGHLTQVVASKE